MNVDFHSAAEREFLQAVDYYNGQKPGLRFEFADQVRDAVQSIRTHPDAWAWISQKDNLRRCRTRRFPYGIIYLVRSDRILILAVAHLRRRPDYWRDRLP